MKGTTALILGALAACLPHFPARAEGTPPDVLAQADELVSGQRVQLGRLTRQMAETRRSIAVSGPSEMQDPAVIERYRERLQVYADTLGRFAPYRDDADVRTALGEYAALREALSAEFARANAQRAESGDVQAILAGIEKALDETPPPGVLHAPFDDDQALLWVQGAADARRVARDALAEIERIAPSAHLPSNPGTVGQGAPYDMQDLTRLRRRAEGNAAKVEETISTTQANLKHRFDTQDTLELDYYRKLDPQDETQRANAFLKEGAEATIYAGLDRELTFAESVAAYQRAFGKEPTANTLARIAEIGALRERYAEDRSRLIGESRLPEPKSDDPERLAAARKILADPAYGFGEHGPIVLTGEGIVTREKTVSRDTVEDVDVSLSGEISWSGTRESWDYEWEEFTFATPIREDDGETWYIWWITAKKFASGWEKTPIGRWVSGTATKGDLILPENFR